MEHKTYSLHHSVFLYKPLSYCFICPLSFFLCKYDESYTKPESHSFCVRTHLATKADSKSEIVELFQKLHTEAALHCLWKLCIIVWKKLPVDQMNEWIISFCSAHAAREVWSQCFNVFKGHWLILENPFFTQFLHHCWGKSRTGKTCVHVVSCERCFSSAVSVAAARDVQPSHW